MWVHLYITSCFSLTAFILSIFNFRQFNYIVSRYWSLWILSCLGLSVLPGFGCLLLHQDRRIFIHSFFK